MTQERLGESDCEKGFILDGFPRTVAQAEAFQAMAEKIDRELDVVFYFKTTEKKVLFRLSGRRTCAGCGAIYHVANRPPKNEGVCDACGGALVTRKDDEPETVKNRLKVYEKETAPLIHYYEAGGLLKKILGDLEVDELDQEVEKVLAASGIR
jgi:adenylate kinase